MGLMCFVCETFFSNQSNLNKHIKRKHNLKPISVSYNQSKYMYKCLEEKCNNSFQHNKGLRNHLFQEHYKKIESEEIEFSNKEEFFAWKKSVEKINKSNYVLSSTSKFRNKSVKYYLCNRSGKVRTKSPNQRRPKTQGSCKLNRNCTSMIKVIEGKTLVISWFKTHYGHTSDLQHIRLAQMDKSEVALKLTLGVPPSKILDSYRDKINEEDLSREDLITRKDIQNIKKAYHVNISEGVKHDNDAITVDTLRQNFSARILSTTTKLQNTDKNTLHDEVILQIQSNLDTIDRLLDLPCSSEESFSIVNCNEPTNKKIKKQDIRVFSPQKKRKVKKSQCKKQTDSEVGEINKNVMSNFKEIIYIPFNASVDHNYAHCEY